MLRGTITKKKKKSENRMCYLVQQSNKNIHLNNKLFYKTQMPLTSSSTLRHGREKKTLPSLLTPTFS